MASASSTPWEKSPGVDGAFAVTMRPSVSTSTQSVKVPPVSIPQMSSPVMVGAALLGDSVASGPSLPGAATVVNARRPAAREPTDPSLSANRRVEDRYGAAWAVRALGGGGHVWASAQAINPMARAARTRRITSDRLT